MSNWLKPYFLLAVLFWTHLCYGSEGLLSVWTPNRYVTHVTNNNSFPVMITVAKHGGEQVLEHILDEGDNLDIERYVYRHGWTYRASVPSTLLEPWIQDHQTSIVAIRHTIVQIEEKRQRWLRGYELERAVRFSKRWTELEQRASRGKDTMDTGSQIYEIECSAVVKRADYVDERGRPYSCRSTPPDTDQEEWIKVEGRGYCQVEACGYVGAAVTLKGLFDLGKAAYLFAEAEQEEEALKRRGLEPFDSEIRQYRSIIEGREKKIQQARAAMARWGRGFQEIETEIQLPHKRGFSPTVLVQGGWTLLDVHWDEAWIGEESVLPRSFTMGVQLPLSPEWSLPHNFDYTHRHEYVAWRLYGNLGMEHIKRAPAAPETLYWGGSPVDDPDFYVMWRLWQPGIGLKWYWNPGFFVDVSTGISILGGSAFHTGIWTPLEQAVVTAQAPATTIPFGESLGQWGSLTVARYHEGFPKEEVPRHGAYAAASLRLDRDPALIPTDAWTLTMGDTNTLASLPTTPGLHPRLYVLVGLAY